MKNSFKHYSYSFSGCKPFASIIQSLLSLLLLISPYL